MVIEIKETLMKNVLVLCNGLPPTEQLFKKCYALADYFIAADGGGDTALEFGTKPDVVVGDLDSFQGPRDDTYDVLFEADQESNDLEKALDVALEVRGTHVTILGATGKRLDHTLKNLSVLKQYYNRFDDVKLVDTYGEIRLLAPSFQKVLPIGTEVSLFPLSGKVTGITTSGLKYPLKDEELENGVRDGSSNEVTETPVRINHEKGDLLLFVGHAS